jgi:two-component system CheB/CheR fusion protein
MTRTRPVKPAAPRARPATRPQRSDAPGTFPIVGIGASAGGLEAFSALLARLPADTGMGFVLVQHLDPDHESALAKLLGRATSLPVHEVTDRLRVEPDQVYVIPPNHLLGISGGVLTLGPRPEGRTPLRSIDAFLETLAADQRERAIGVILSGTATDGTLGLEAIKGEGGITFAQDESARYDSMPRSAVATGCVDFVLPLEAIADELARIAKHPVVRGGEDWPRSAEDDRAAATAHEEDETPLPSGGHGRPETAAGRARTEAARQQRSSAADTASEAGFKRILLLLRNHSGVDFSLYKSSTIQRRIMRRIVLCQQQSLDDYARFLKGNAKELDALYSDTLISVTSFFRNPEAFEVIERKVWPTLLRQPGDAPLRVWVLGCSTGQEAYSIAMAFVEAADKAPRMRKLQVFATDLNEALLEKARHGLYAKSVAQDLSPERLGRFFTEEEGGYRIAKSLREMVVFARQNVVVDPPFSRLDLISCRNLLIYFEPALQRKVFPVFHYALKTGGFLYLGASESVGPFTDLFEPLDKKHRIYTRRAAPTPGFHLPPAGAHLSSASGPEAAAPRHGRGSSPLQPLAQARGADAGQAELSAHREADRIAVQQFAPPGVLVNAELQVLQFRGATSAFLAPATGKASFDVLKMARPGLMLPLRALINRARKENRAQRRDGVTVEDDDGTQKVAVEVIPLTKLKESCFLIVFERADGKPRRTATPRAGARRRGDGSPPDASLTDRTTELETELGETRDYLQSMQEQHEAAAEELQASNEEVQSANEELQSLNEELETSKEELESANEELMTVNEEMAARNSELLRLNSDLVNIQASTQQAIVLLARDLTIRRFSVQAEKQFHLTASDIGRPIANVRHGLGIPDLNTFVSDVIDRVRGAEREVQDADGRWFLLRVHPYLTLDSKVDGAVLLTVDIDDLKRSERTIAAERDYADAILRTTRDPLLILETDLRVHTANDAFYRTFGMTSAEVAGRAVYALGNRQWDIPRLRELLEEVPPRGSSFDEFEVTHDFPALGRRTMLLNGRRLRDGVDQSARILLGFQDITERKRAEEARRDGEARLKLALDVSKMGTFTWFVETDRGEPDDQMLALFGLPPGGTLTLKEALTNLIHPDDRAGYAEAVAQATEPTGTGLLRADIRVVRRDKSVRWLEVNGRTFFEGEPRRATRMSGVAIDITERRKTELQLREAAQRKDEFLAMLAHELRNPLAQVRTGLELIRLAGDTAASVERVRSMMERQVGHMVRLVDDLLDVSRITSGKVQLKREPTALAFLLQQAIEAHEAAITERGLALTVDLPEAECLIDVDPTRFVQVLSNLLHNATKFTDRGGWIRVVAGVSPPDGPEPPLLTLRISDSGIGMPAELVPRVFELFTQGTAVHSQPGLGIGLALARQVMNLHGGELSAHSAGLGQGSEFVISLPLLPPGGDQPAAATQGQGQAAQPGHRVLVIDDNRDSATATAMLVEALGCNSKVAYNGEAGIRLASAFVPDIVLLDIGMPGLDGYETCRRIRKLVAPVPLMVALTGYAKPPEKGRDLHALFDHHLTKPADPSQLTALLSWQAGTALAREDGEERPPQAGTALAREDGEERPLQA